MNCSVCHLGTMSAPRQQGFTALELMMVIAIMIVVSTMAIPAAFSSMRYVTFSKAQSDIMALHNEARNAAMLGNGPGNVGVRWSFNEGQWVGQLLRNTGAVSGTERSLPGSLLFMADGSVISDNIEWWYERGSGRIVNGSGSPAMVGLPAPDFPEVHRPVMISGQSEDDPGLEISTRQSDLRAAIRVYPIGLMTISKLAAAEGEEE